MTSNRVFSLLLLAMLTACGGNDIGNCPSYQPQGQWCWEGVTRDNCDQAGGQLTSRSCAALGFGCPDVQQWNSPTWCIDHCEAANVHLADCGIAPLDCSESAALSHTSCVNACLTVDACDQLQTDPLLVCGAQCTTFVPD